MKHCLFFLFVTVLCLENAPKLFSQGNTPKLAATIQMPQVAGRIDHFTYDKKRQVIFVAALGNNTIEVADLKSNKVIHSIKNLHKPQGLLFIPENDAIFVANGDVLECDIFDAKTFEKITSVKLPGGADNVRYDPAEKKIYVGYANGIAIIDAGTYKLLSEIKLSGHPESFQIDKASKKMFVNIPDSKVIEVIDLRSNAIIGTWKMSDEKNYPMALDQERHRLFVGFRQPAKLLVFDSESGKIISSHEIDGDVDDVFYNPAGRQIYLSCGDGYVDVFKQEDADTYKSGERVTTRPGARTCFFIPESKQLIVASPLKENVEAALLVYKLD